MNKIQNLESHTTRHETGCGALYVTIDTLNDKPYQVFIQNTQCGCQSAVNVIARCISARLQEGTSLDEIIKPLKKPHCEECIKLCSEGKSCWDIVAKELIKYKKSTKVIKLKSVF